MFLKAILIASLVKLLTTTEKPILCAGIYTGLVFFLGIMFGMPISHIIITTSVSFALSFLYFWLLDRFKESLAFWFILAAGLLIGFV